MAKSSPKLSANYAPMTLGTLLFLGALATIALTLIALCVIERIPESNSSIPAQPDLGDWQARNRSQTGAEISFQ